MMKNDDTTMDPRMARARAAPVATARVLFAGATVRGDVHALRHGATVIGRGADSLSGIRIEDDPRLSREHAALVLQEGRVIVDNKSRNGTLKNGVAVPAEGSPVADGDVLRLGDTFILVRFVPADVVDAKVPAVVGVSPAAARLRSTIRLLAPTNATVLLLGPTGAGKDVTARAIHDESGRRGAFVPVNTTAIPESLAESQLFGHVAGSFTGAKDNHPGWFREADGGTLFLDEVGDIPPALQAKLLRVLDDKRVTPVGATSSSAVDVRLVAATNADLEARVQQGRFRGDLFARLAEIMVPLPRLAARKEDVLPLFEHALPKGHPPFDAALVAALLSFDWPYNVREVMKVATELTVRGAGRARLELDLVEDRLRAAARLDSDTDGAPVAADPSLLPVPDKGELERLIKQHKGVIADIARATGRSRKQVYRWLDKHGLRGSISGDDEG